MPRIKCPYTYPHRSRKDRVAYLTSIGGYFSRDGRFPIEFNVSLGSVDGDVEHLWAKTVESDNLAADMTEQETLRLRTAFWRVFKENEQHIWEWGRDDMCRSLTEDDTYKTLWSGKTVDVKLELHGRGGKHLVIAEFDGVSLNNCNPEELEELLMEKDDGAYCISVSWLDTFYRYVRQCESDFKSDKICAEWQYQAAYQVWSLAESMAEDLAKEEADKAALAVHATALYEEVIEYGDEELVAAWRSLCTAAGVDTTKIVT